MIVANYNNYPNGNNNLRTTTTISFKARKAIKDDGVNPAPPHSVFHPLTGFEVLFLCASFQHPLERQF
jgi:hypothetical protein